ncbi:MAG: RIP metalloprotease RseP [Elusimicrobia bacterium RIFOXYD2_FULL_34_15]|nr:MAG: RIP metalloprotease RseP [Elusimicrobia bacterium RIFOXYD2_FULL_34_15]
MILLGIVAVAVMFGFVIMIHEFGHFIVAKKQKVKVLSFSFGFGPELIGWTKGETRYSIRPIPFGGFVKMAGEEIDEHKGEPDEYFSKKWYQRIAIVAAGPVMNYLSGFLLFLFVIGFWGIQYQRPVVKMIEKNSPAFIAGLKSGDEIIAIDNNKIQDAQIVSKAVKDSGGKELLFSIKRNDKIIDIKITPKYDERMKYSRIGIAYDTSSEPIVVKVSFKKAIKESFDNIVFWTVTPLKYLYMKLTLFEAPSEVSGPIGIMQAAYFAAKLGIKTFLTFIAIVSVALGMFNLFPIPIVDGGHIMFYLIEGISGKPINKKAMQLANSIGFALLLTLALYATYQDILRTKDGFWKKVEQSK